MTFERDSRKLMKMLENDGWMLDRVRGSHHQFKHPVKKGRVTLVHPEKDIRIDTVRSIYKQAGWH